jgi:hypothetical protein
MHIELTLTSEAAAIVVKLFQAGELGDIGVLDVVESSLVKETSVDVSKSARRKTPDKDKKKPVPPVGLKPVPPVGLKPGPIISKPVQSIKDAKSSHSPIIKSKKDSAKDESKRSGK